MTEEHKQNISKGRKKFYKDGGIHPMKGKHHSKESCKKISISRTGIKLPPFTKEHKKKIGRSGALNAAWKGGISTENTLARNTPEYKEWRKQILKRDNYKCKKCTTNKGHLIAHHIQNFSEYIDLRHCLSNGITLCISCHKLFHKLYGLRHNNLAQIDEFLKEVLDFDSEDYPV